MSGSDIEKHAALWVANPLFFFPIILAERGLRVSDGSPTLEDNKKLPTSRTGVKPRPQTPPGHQRRSSAH